MGKLHTGVFGVCTRDTAPAALEDAEEGAWTGVETPNDADELARATEEEPGPDIRACHDNGKHEGSSKSFGNELKNELRTSLCLRNISAMHRSWHVRDASLHA